MTTFFTSDTHFGHRNILQHCDRPFASVEAMDEAMIRQWNAVVGPKDTVYHLGDFSLQSASRVEYYLSRLNGTKHLIQGNHDTVQGVNGWESVQDMAQISVDGHKVFLCHYPLREWPGMWGGAVHLYGHVHGNLQPQPGSMDMGADAWGGTPVTLERILRAVKPFAKDRQQKQGRFQVVSWQVRHRPIPGE